MTAPTRLEEEEEEADENEKKKKTTTMRGVGIAEEAFPPLPAPPRTAMSSNGHLCAAACAMPSFFFFRDADIILVAHLQASSSIMEKWPSLPKRRYKHEREAEAERERESVCVYVCEMMVIFR